MRHSRSARSDPPLPSILGTMAQPPFIREDVLMTKGKERERGNSRHWAMIRAARQRLADDLAPLAEEDWRHPTLCDGWDVEHVVAHLTAAGSIGRWRWIRSMVGAGFRPDVHNERRLREHLGGTPAETLQAFQHIIGAQIAPTADTAAYLGEVLVHSEDIRHALGIPTAEDLGALTAVAEFYARHDFTVPSKSLTSGLRLEADDGPFKTGDGPEVRGPTLALVMTMAGRGAYVDQLEGSGRAALVKRLGP